jgi:hypothetical protein
MSHQHHHLVLIELLQIVRHINVGSLVMLLFDKIGIIVRECRLIYRMVSRFSLTFTNITVEMSIDNRHVLLVIAISLLGCVINAFEYNMQIVKTFLCFKGVHKHI